MKLLIVNGPNLNMLGIREPDLYGIQDYSALCGYITQHARRLGIEADIFQSNHEGELIDRIQRALGNADAIIVNPAAYTHTSIALLDTLKAVGLPACEVHLTNPDQREDFRKTSYVRLYCEKTFAGFGFDSYRMAMEYLVATCRKDP